MKDKDKDKRLVLPRDAFEEEASEGLGRMSREEAKADLRDLKGRMERRLRKPRLIWLPATAAVVILLVASTIYISLFRERGTDLSGIARSEEAKTGIGQDSVADMTKADTALIAMAEPIQKKENSSDLSETSAGLVAAKRTAESKSARQAELADMDVMAAVAEPDEEMVDEMINAAEKNEIAEVVVSEVAEEEAQAEEVIVEAIPMMQKAALRSNDNAKEKDSVRPAAAGQEAAVQGAVMPDRAASPAGGMEEFREWIARNLIYPEGVDPVVRQVIVVTFRVRADSTLYDLKAERTAGDLFTQEAFRLILEGPKWKPAVRGGQPVEEEVRVSIVFK
ncbi:hypothetical protein EG827_07295 [bacterium]|nr:hypothetical protein [bacterium]